MTISITRDPRHPRGAAGRRPRRAAAGRRSSHAGLQLATGDIVVVCQKIVSKAEGRIARLERRSPPSPFAQQIAAQTTDKDPRIVEVILRETNRIVKMDRGHLIVETGPGLGVRQRRRRRVEQPGRRTSSSSCPRIPTPRRSVCAPRLRERTGADVAVLITDTFGRPWREGLVDFALGVAGMDAQLDLRGEHDLERPRAASHGDGAGRRPGRRRRPGDAQGRRHPRGPRPRLRVHVRRTGNAKSLIRAPEFDLFR